MMPPDPSTLSPKDVGRVLALSLSQSCGPNSLVEQERKWVAEATIPLETYLNEVFFLAAFAVRHAIEELLANSPVRADVLDGYIEVWNNQAKQSPINAALVPVFFKRCEVYAKAVQRRAPDEAFDPLALAFGGFFDEENGLAQALALAMAPVKYSTHYKGAEHLLRLAKRV